MKKLFLLLGIGFLLLQVGLADLYGQGRLLRRLQDEMERRAVEEIFGPEKRNDTSQPGDPGTSPSARNRRGSGLEQSIPDVSLHIDEARSSYAAASYSPAKAALRQALWGVELEMGKQVLASLPETVGGMSYMEKDDRVSSTGIGFVGMLIQRRYAGNDDMEMNLSVGNDSGLFGLARIAAASGMYMDNTEQPNHKQIRFQDHNAYIQYDDYDGYMLSVPFGQASIFMLQGANFDTEGQFMSAAGQFNLQSVKQKLGEQ